MLPLCRALAALLLSASAVVANVEKVIFTGPEPVSVPRDNLISGVNIHTLSPDASIIRTDLSRVFPGTDDKALGQSTWLLLDDLVAGQRYEFRVCWAAIEPTSFTIDIHELDAVQSTPKLAQSLSEYMSSLDTHSNAQKPHAHEPVASGLLLHIQAAADYYTDDQALMKNPPPVLVDLILDPYLYNVVPRSLVPTVGYLIVVGIVTWFVAQWIASTLRTIASPAESQSKKRK